MDAELITIDERRTKQVNKKNAVIRNSRFCFSLIGQKTVLFVVSRLNPFEECDSVEFDVKDYAETMGFNRSGQMYNDVKKALKEVRDTSVFIETTKGKEISVSFWTKVHLDGKAGKIKLDLDPDIKPFLFHLKSDYTHYELIWTLRLKSKYSIRLYEFLRSYHYNELEQYTVKFDLDTLKKRIDAEKYTRWDHFKNRALMPAVNEINEYTDKHIDVEPIKTGRNVTHIRFTITSIVDVLERDKRQVRIEQELDMNQYRFKGMSEE